MNKIKAGNFRIKDIVPFEHLEFILKHTTPYQRFKWLEKAWDFWYRIRKANPKRIIELQNKFREGKI